MRVSRVLSSRSLLTAFSIMLIIVALLLLVKTINIFKSGDILEKHGGCYYLETLPSGETRVVETECPETIVPDFPPSPLPNTITIPTEIKFPAGSEVDVGGHW